MKEIDMKIKINIEKLIKVSRTKKANKRVIFLLKIALSLFLLCDCNIPKGKI